LIVTGVPTGPLVGLKLVTTGTVVVTVKFVLEFAVPIGVVTEIGPVVVPLATDAVICETLFTVNVVAA